LAACSTWTTSALRSPVGRNDCHAAQKPATCRAKSRHRRGWARDSQSPRETGATCHELARSPSAPICPSCGWKGVRAWVRHISDDSVSALGCFGAAPGRAQTFGGKVTSGWVAPGRCRPGAPADPDVRTLAHPVPRPTGSPSTMVPEAIRSSYGDMQKNLDVFNMFPSIDSAGRRFAFLHRVLRGEFPCFNGTIKALRLPAARPAALRFLRLAVPQLHSLRSLPGGRVHRRGLELVTRYLHPGISEETSWISQVPGESSLSVCTCSHRRRQDCSHQTTTVQQRGPRTPRCRG
jgi:hypothetical protein